MSWGRIKLKNYCHVVTKGTTPTSIGYGFENEGIPFLRIQNLSDGTVNLDDVLFINNETHKALKRSIIKPKDFLITIAGTIGRVAIVPDDFPESNCNQAVAILRFDHNKLRPAYLKHWLGTNDALAQIAGKKVTATISNLSLGQIKELEIPIPLPDDPEKSLKEQQRIAAILDKAYGIRRKRQQAIELADEFLRSVFLDMFGDPVTNPKGWEVNKLGEICGVGSSKRVFVEQFVESGIPFYRGTEVGKLGENIEIFPELFISEEHYRNLVEHSGKPELGDLLLPSICPDGRIWKVSNDAPFYFKDGRVLWIKAGKSSIDSDYLKGYLRRIFFSNYSSIASGTTFAELKIVALKNLNVMVPPQVEQEKFKSIINAVERNITRQIEGMEVTETQFSSLTQKAFKGEL